MIDALTANRFVLLTPFQEPCVYYRRLFVEGVATDTFKAYALSTARTRELTKEDVPLFVELMNKETLVFELWQPVLDAANMPAPKKDDWIKDTHCREWTVFHVLGELHENVYTLVCVKKV